MPSAKESSAITFTLAAMSLSAAVPPSESLYSSTTVATRPLPHLPDEIILQILKKHFETPSGLHSDRWPIYQRMRVDRLLATPYIANIVPEALYKDNLVVLKPKPKGTAKDIPLNKPIIAISYPKPAVNNWVQQLEFRAWVETCATVSQPVWVQVRWLRHLAGGVIGFKGLDTLRLIFDGSDAAKMQGFVQMLLTEAADNGVFKFAVKTVEVVVGKCSNTGDSAADLRTQQDLQAKVEAVMVAH